MLLNNKQQLERKIFVCDCQSLEHQISFWHDPDDEELYAEPHLITHRNFFKRLWYALKYTFGYKSRFGAFDEVIFSPEMQQQLRDWLNSHPNPSKVKE